MDSNRPQPGNAFRPWAALMLWVWMISQTACVAHCHGLLPSAPDGNEGTPSVGKPSSAASSGRAHRGHACCSRTRSSESGKLPDTAGPVQDSQARNPESSAESPTPCAAKLAVHAADPLGNLASASLTGGSQPSPAWMVLVGLVPDPLALLALLAKIPASPPYLEDPSSPRWDAGYEPSVTLGCGLRSLAPPSLAGS